MTYTPTEVVNIAITYNNLLCGSGNFHYSMCMALDQIPKTAKKALEAIEKYKQLPKEIIDEFEKNYSTRINYSKLEEECKKALEGKIK